MNTRLSGSGGALPNIILACWFAVFSTAAWAQPLPTPWVSADIGSPALSGSTTSPAVGSFTVTGAGIDIWNNTDQFQFVYQPVQGDVTIVARVMNVQATDQWSKAGIMIRQSLTAGSPHVSMFATAANPWSFIYRPVANGISFDTRGTTTQVPGWVRLARAGNLITGSYSLDGSNWTQLDSESITMGATVYVGLAVTSHNPNARATDAFTNVVVTGPSSNQVPTVSLTSPTPGQTFTAPASITLNATASDADGTVSKVDFYQGATLIGTDTTSPYSFTWSNVAAGSYTLTARATDNASGLGTSANVNVTVNPASNTAPSVSVTAPTPGASFTAPASVTIQAAASDTDGTVSKVDFYQGATLLGTDTSSPYAFTWSNVPAGNYSLTARATDNRNAVTTSTAVTVTVSTATNQLPTVSITSPVAGASYPAPASMTIAANASDSDGTIVGVDFYHGSTLIGTDTSNPYTAAWNNVAAGSYSLTAVARDNAGGSRTSSAVSISVTGGGSLSPWINTDIGTPALSGSASSTGAGAFTVTGAGSDIWGTSDQFHFVYQAIQGDMELIARVASVQNTDPWSKGGVMVRAALTPGSRNVTMVGTSGNGWSFQYRLTDNAQSGFVVGAGGTPPGWVKLRRVGNVVTASYSPNGTTWTTMGTQTLTLGTTIYVGLAVTSHNVNARATDTFSNVTVTPLTSGNQPPTVAITSPASGASFTAPASITINAGASDPDGSIASVDFFHGSTLISSDTSSPYSATWSSVPAGTYALTAVARDNTGATTASGPVSVTVGATSAPTRLVFTVAPDHATTVSSYVVAIYRAADPLTASPAATADIGKPTPVNNDISVDITSLLNPLPSGSYKIVVRAVGPGGTTSSTPSPNFTK